MLRPRAAAERLCQGEPGGLGDAAWLLLLRLLSTEGQVLVRGALRARDEGLGALGDAVLLAASALVPDLLLIAGGGVVLGLLLRGGERVLRPGLTVDLSAQAWIGWLAVHVLFSLGLTLLQRQPGAAARTAVQIVALGAFARGCGYALGAARAAARRAAASEKHDA